MLSEMYPVIGLVTVFDDAVRGKLDDLDLPIEIVDEVHGMLKFVPPELRVRHLEIWFDGMEELSADWD